MFPINYSIIIAYAIFAGGGALANIRGDFSSHEIFFYIQNKDKYSFLDCEVRFIEHPQKKTILIILTKEILTRWLAGP